MTTRRSVVAGLIGLAAASLSGRSTETRAEPRIARRRPAVAFGTTVSLTLVGPHVPEIEAAFVSCFRALREVEKAANLFDPTSEISRLNAAGRLEAPSDDLSTLIRFSLHLAEVSGGAFDPTVQPLWCAWHDAARQGRLPGEAALRAAREKVDHRAVRLTNGAVVLDRPGMALTLNALAQGLAADRVCAAAAASGLTDAFIDTGEIGALGHAADRHPWRVGIAHPRKAATLTGMCDLGPQRFLATSGDMKCAWTPDFAEHHIVEPWSGHSPKGLSEVVVEAASGLTADGLATALMVTGTAGARRLLALDSTAGAVLIDKGGAVETFGF
ncbi:MULTISPECIES: FAD:protein FMN transferase [Xanthobacter]|uniref:FAD:protein FMN transferase n=1 Tax=Xanthobacter TaxID=279 RepID=UPI0024A648B7|nr:FAD:protein FMN transferase [Xanthobacter autotrophicus]MDI4658511.1 FAD:protein FMN transferase [Xanthobacter autotrophicus]MDI4665302.1 FAD:protein FMN transferase [Xanthobacter autotrophicus]